MLEGLACDNDVPPTWCGRALLVDGNSAQAFDPTGTNTDTGLPGLWTGVSSPQITRSQHSATGLRDGSILVAGGQFATGTQIELYVPGPTDVDPPTVTGVTPGTGSECGGDPVQVRGSDFRDVQAVEFGGVEARYRATSATDIEAVTPRHHPGPVDVVVRTAGGPSSGGAGVFTYTPAGTETGTWRTTAPLTTPRARHTSTLLRDGRVLVAGGLGPDQQPLDGAEIYSPSTGTWRSAPAMETLRYAHTATLLGDGTVLVIGGYTAHSTETEAELSEVPVASAEIFDPAGGGGGGTWREVGGLIEGRAEHTATLLEDGRVLVAGGRTAASRTSGALYASRSAEIYLPGDERFTPTRPLEEERARHTATRLRDGRVLAAGGLSSGILRISSVEIYDPAAGRWSPASDMGGARSAHDTGLLSDGRVFVAGGAHASDSIEIYDPARDAWQLVALIVEPRVRHTATGLPGGEILLAGGERSSSASGAEMYRPGLTRTAPSGCLDTPRLAHTAVRLAGPACRTSSPPGLCGSVLFVGGRDGTLPVGHWGALSAVELYTPRPTVDRIVPDEGPAGTETAGMLTGDNLAGTNTVRFGGQAVPCPSEGCTVDSMSHITVTAPPAGKGAVEVTVTTPGGTSDPVTFTYRGLPGRVSDLSATPLSRWGVELDFGVVDEGDAITPASAYRIAQSTTPIRSEEDFKTAPTLCGGLCRFEPAEIGERLSVTVEDLRHDTTYHYAVRALGPDGRAGPFSESVAVTTRADASPPGAVADLEARALSESTAELTWAAPGSDGEAGPPAARFVVKQSTQGPIRNEAGFADGFALCDGACEFGPSQVGETLTLRVTNLRPGTTYHYTLRAVDEAGNRGPLSNPVSATTAEATRGVVRISGADRIETAAAISRRRFADRQAGTVVLARSDVFADGLAGTPLAASRDAPLLLTPPDRLDSRTEAELSRVASEDALILLLGGEAALAPAVEERIQALGYETLRFGGRTRYETAVAIARSARPIPEAILLATGRDFADAAAAGTAAGASRGVVLLTDGERLPPATAAYLREHPEVPRFAAGGPAARAAPEAVPLVGENRYRTAVAVARQFFPSPRVLGLATGERFPDALTGGAHTAHLGGPLLLSPAEALPEAVRTWVQQHDEVETAVLYGGRTALSARVEQEVRDGLG